MLSIMYSGYMFVATSLLSVYCPLLHRPLRQYGAVRLDVTIMIRMMVCVVTVTVVVSIVIHTSRIQELSAGCPQ